MQKNKVDPTGYIQPPDLQDTAENPTEIHTKNYQPTQF